ARAAGIPTREINLAPSDTAGLFDEASYGPATRAVPDFVAEILGEENPGEENPGEETLGGQGA
ncbi:hypothetical protein NS229_24550, partial [Methylobacterium indicum]